MKKALEKLCSEHAAAFLFAVGMAVGMVIGAISKGITICSYNKITEEHEHR